MKDLKRRRVLGALTGRPELKVGDIVIIHKPKNLDESPGWVDGMDKYDGTRAKIKHFVPSYSSDAGSIILYGIYGRMGVIKDPWYFNSKWLELTE